MAPTGPRPPPSSAKMLAAVVSVLSAFALAVGGIAGIFR